VNVPPYLSPLTVIKGFIQAVVILLVTWLAVRFKTKSIFLGILLVPCIVGSGLLYGGYS
jgi:hypothetical protein